MLAATLPLLPPPIASIFPPPNHSLTESSAQTQQHASQYSSRRSKAHNAALRNSTLAILTSDERTITQRKMAIAMYGYSWLKPAGCAKTMLGRREEELEREEVERQLREVELSERMAQEADEQERQAQLADTGEPVEGRDLDEDIPDMDAEEGEEDEEADLDDEIPDMDAEDEMEGDLDDEIPDADEIEDDEPASPDPDGAESNWIYDSRREPDSPANANIHGDPASPDNRRRQQGHFRHGTATVAGVRIPVPGSEYDYQYDEREAEDLANAMLDEDEIFDDEEDIERDLDDDVPDAGSEQAWEHTDTELEETEMDISILPEQNTRTSAVGTQTQSRPSHPRRSSGPWIADHPLGHQHRSSTGHARPTPPDAYINSRARVSSGNRPHHPHYLPHNPQPQSHRQPRLNIHPLHHRQPIRNPYLQTPELLDSPISPDERAQAESDDGDDDDDILDPFNSTNPTRRVVNTGAHERNSVAVARTQSANTGSARQTARNWLDGAAAVVGEGARRTLFGRGTRRGAGGQGGEMADASGSGSGGLFTPPALAGLARGRDAHADIGIGGGGGVGGGARQGEWESPSDVIQAPGQGQREDQQSHAERIQPQSRRSARFLGARQRLAS